MLCNKRAGRRGRREGERERGREGRREELIKKERENRGYNCLTYPLKRGHSTKDQFCPLFRGSMEKQTYY